MSKFVDKPVNALLPMLQELFKKLGFSEKEAVIYTILNQRGANSVSVLSQLTKIKRTSIYDILKELMARDLVMSFQQGGTTYFAIDDVQKISFEQKERLNYAQQLINQLKSTAFDQEHAMQVNYYRGQEGYREMYEDVLRQCKTELLGCLENDNLYSGIDEKREEQWTKERYEKGIKVRLILQDSKSAREKKKEDKGLNRETRIIPKNKFPYQSSSFIYENYLTFFYAGPDGFLGVRINHAEFANLQRQMFEMSWSLLG